MNMVHVLCEDTEMLESAKPAGPQRSVWARVIYIPYQKWFLLYAFPLPSLGIALESTSEQGPKWHRNILKIKQHRCLAVSTLFHSLDQFYLAREMLPKWLRSFTTPTGTVGCDKGQNTIYRMQTWLSLVLLWPSSKEDTSSCEWRMPRAPGWGEGKGPSSQDPFLALLLPCSLTTWLLLPQFLHL